MPAYSILLMATAGIASLSVSATPQKCLKKQVLEAHFRAGGSAQSCPDKCTSTLKILLTMNNDAGFLTYCQQDYRNNLADIRDSGSKGQDPWPICHCRVNIALSKILVSNDNFCRPQKIASRWALKLPHQATVYPAKKNPTEPEACS